MKIRQMSLAMVVALAAAAPVQAAESPFYFRAMAGLMDPSAGGHDNTFNVGGGVGFQVFDQPNGSGAIEGDITTTLVKGDKDNGGDWHLDTVAVYFAYRTAGDVFFKAKGGFADQSVSSTDNVPDGSVVSAGIGVGWRATRKAGAEMELTVFDHMKFLSIGIYSHF